MPPTRQELLAAVCASPDDDAPRRAYAEAIAPYDAERSTFVRLQLDRAGAERAGHAPRGHAGPEEAQLARTHGAEWARYLAKYCVEDPANSTDPGWQFERGFIAFARIAIHNVVGLGGRLFEMAPIQHLDIAPGDPPVRRLFALPELGHLDSLSLAGLGLDDDDAIALAGCDALRRCTWLDLGRNRIGERGVLALARSPVMANKVRVLLDGNPCNPVEEPSFDWDGSVASMTGGAGAAAIETAAGRVAWLHYPWARRADEPDRFHAKYAALA